ncbi:hypothetical protein WJX74_004068 [Apatococcus lobatus]|uniref:Uncharacterized protein n=1 Tax=Apatococcus lobatus TaxID=904363 RepID=A0AAW1QH83_9CHLO
MLGKALAACLVTCLLVGAACEPVHRREVLSVGKNGQSGRSEVGLTNLSGSNGRAAGYIGDGRKLLQIPSGGNGGAGGGASNSGPVTGGAGGAGGDSAGDIASGTSNGGITNGGAGESAPGEMSSDCTRAHPGNGTNGPI